MQRKTWTPEEDATLKHLFKRFRNALNVDNEIYKKGVLLGRSANAIRIRRSKIGAVLHTAPKSFYNLTKKIKPGKYNPPNGTPLTLDLKTPKANETVVTVDLNKLQGLPGTLNGIIPQCPHAAGVITIYSTGSDVYFKARNMQKAEAARLMLEVCSKIV